MGVTGEPLLPDYDQLPISELRHRVRSLTEAQLRELVDHEHRHGNRTPVLQLLTTRLQQLEDGAQPAPADQTNAPGVSATPVDPSISSAPAPRDQTPLRHGVHDQTPSRGQH